MLRAMGTATGPVPAGCRRLSPGALVAGRAKGCVPQPRAPSSAPGGSSASSHCQPPRDLILVCVEVKGRFLYLSRVMASF